MTFLIETIDGQSMFRSNTAVLCEDAEKERSTSGKVTLFQSEGGSTFLPELFSLPDSYRSILLSKSSHSADRQSGTAWSAEKI
jgi:hypothetical protein